MGMGGFNQAERRRWGAGAGEDRDVQGRPAAHRRCRRDAEQAPGGEKHQ